MQLGIIYTTIAYTVRKQETSEKPQMDTQKPISTVTVPEDAQGANDVKLEIMREIGQGADWHNRYVRHADTKVSRILRKLTA